MSVVAPPAPRTTARGTPCAVSWGEAWVAQVDAREQALDRRICGARTIGGTPCPLPSDHASGRCRHHGGFALTGAPADNRNAVVHGLYSRRLMICGPHCPAWQSCPMGGGSTFSLENEMVEPKEIDSGPIFIRHPDGSTEQRYKGMTIHNPPPGGHDENGDPIEQNNASGGRVSPRAGVSERAPAREDARPPTPPLSYAQALLRLPMSERPLCPYEQAEYHATVTDLMPRTCAQAENAFGLHLAHQIALLTVMVSRAARALAVAPLTETLEQTAQQYHMSVTRPSASLVAFEKLSRELRRWIAMLDQHYGPPRAAQSPAARESELRRQTDTLADPDALAALDLTSALAQQEHARKTAARDAETDAIDRQIVDSLFARCKVKPHNNSHTEATERTEPSTGDG